MVCLSESIKRQSFVDRAELLGLSLARAEFLAACSHTQVDRNEANRTNLIPYDPAVLIREAFRIGIGLNDAAKMMEMTRAEVMAKLHAAGVGSGVHYPPSHLFAIYRRLGWKEGDCPQAEAVGRSILTLPLFPTMARSDVTRVVNSLVKILADHKKA